MFEKVRGWFKGRGGPQLSQEEFERERENLMDRVPVPVFWLFGKTGSGKSSIVKYLTGAEDAEIGSGFKPQTQFSSRYAFPSEESPLIEFLDTRGVGESRYDPAEDIQANDQSAHLMIVTARMADHAAQCRRGTVENHSTCQSKSTRDFSVDLSARTLSATTTPQTGPV